jgi:hypothetical protein
VRLEERFEFETAEWTLDASVRLRYRLQTKIGWKGVREGAHWRLLAHFEGFLTLTGEAGQFDERVRLGLDIERAFASPWQVRGGVTWQQERAFSSATTDEVYIRVRFFHTLTPS